MKSDALLLAIAVAVITVPAAAQPAATDVADQVRLQGYPCEGQAKVERDQSQSRPDEQAWILTCSNATYRVRLVPDMAAQIEKLR
jgi:hypothetical protein